jgi:type IV secretion system protein VirB10
MRRGLIFAFIFPFLASAQDFAGVWLFQDGESQLDRLPAKPAARLTIGRDGGKYTCAECGPGGWAFTTDRKSTETRATNMRNSAAAKWEGDSLMINVMVIPTSSQQYIVMDRWQIARDGAKLTITREYQHGASSTVSKLVYRREGAAAPAPPSAPIEAPAAQLVPTPVVETPTPRPVPQPVKVQQPEPEPEREHILEAGARLPLRSLSAFSSKSAKEGDRVYLETAQPVSRFGKLLLPAGTQITATVAFAQGAGRIKGRGELQLRFESLTTPNGVTKDFRGQATGADATAGRVDGEGRIKAGGSKGRDAGTVGTTTATGAIIGASAGHAGIGAAAGAAAGLARVLGSRGSEVNINRGDMVEMSLDREIRFTEKEVR